MGGFHTRFRALRGALAWLTLLALAACADETYECGPESCPTGWVCSADGSGCVAAEPRAPAAPLPGTWVSVAPRPDGLACVATYDSARDALAVGWLDDAGAVRYHFPDGAGDPPEQRAPAARDVGQYPSVAVGGDGFPRVAYYDRTGGDLRFARFDGERWHVETVDGEDADVGRYASLAIDAQDRPHVAYYDATSRALRYATRGEAGWTVETVPRDALAASSVDGEPGAAAGPLAALAGDTDYGRYASLALSLGQPVVAFYEATGGDLLLATRAGDAWSVIVLDGRDPETGADRSDVGRHATIAVDARGDVSVAYFDATAGALRYVRSAGGVLQVEVVDDGTTGPDGAAWSDCGRHTVGQRAALVVGADSRPRIAYLDATDLTLRYAERAGATRWSRRVLDAEPGAGVWLDHALVGGASFVAYAHVDLYRARPTELRFAKVAP